MCVCVRAHKTHTFGSIIPPCADRWRVFLSLSKRKEENSVIRGVWARQSERRFESWSVWEDQSGITRLCFSGFILDPDTITHTTHTPAAETTR